MSGAEEQGRNICPSLCPSPPPAWNESDGFSVPSVCVECLPGASGEQREEASSFLEVTDGVVEPVTNQENKHIVANKNEAVAGGSQALDTGPGQLSRALTQRIHFPHWKLRPRRGDGLSGAQSKTVTELGPEPLSLDCCELPDHLCVV